MSAEKGRLIKKNDKQTMDKIEISDYPWKSLCASEMTLPDNIYRSLIFSESHSKQELNGAMRHPTEFSTNLVAKQPINLPLDLSLDYQKGLEELTQRKKRRLMDEDEAVALELAELQSNRDNPLHKWNKTTHGGKAAQGHELKEGETAEPENSQAPKSAHSQAPVPGVTPVSTPATSGAHGNVANQNEEKTFASTLKHEIMEDKNVTPKEDTQTEIPHSNIPHPENINEKSRDESLQVLTDNVKKEAFSAGYEAGFQVGQKEGAEKGKEEGNKTGYTDGFKLGEEKGEAAGEAKLEKIFKMLNEVLNEIDHLRIEALNTGQDIFMELTKLATEKILRTQLKVNDEVLKKFFSSVISPYAEKEYLSIEMNKEDAQKMQTLVGEIEIGKKLKIKENSTLPVGDFKIQADNEVVFVDLKKTIDNLIDHFKDDLFAENKVKKENIEEESKAEIEEINSNENLDKAV